jgi:oxaloacetate decarboxylase (Na+ extruding) subunit alpha
MPRVLLTDLTLRDGHQSLFATRMLTADMLPVAGLLDRAGFWSLETWGGATFDACIRFLNEDPWERLRQLKAAMPKSRQQMLLRGQNLLGYRHYADDVVEAFVEQAARTGVDVFRIFDALNDTRNIETALRAVKKAGKHAQTAISYALTPVHTVEVYVDLAVRMQRMGADSICIKDMAGLLKPYDAVKLTRAIKQKVGLPIQIHSHTTTGMAVATLVKAAEAGAERLDTTVSAMSMGTSHSPAETIVEILRGTEWDTEIDLALLTEIATYFRDLRPKYRAFESAVLGADTRILVSQVPGGMMSNLESQLREQGAAGKMDQVLAEIAVVQKDFGYPPLVTPTSQIVGTQAVMNVLFGRYKRLTTESRNPIVGLYGDTPVDPEPALLSQALRESNMTKPVEDRPADAMGKEMSALERELKEKTGCGEVSREDVLTYAMFPQVALQFFKTRDKGPVRMEAAREDKPAAARSPEGPNRYVVTVDGQTHRVTCEESAGKRIYTVDGQRFEIAVADDASAPTPASAPPPSGQGVPVLAPMPATIVRRTCEEGATVAENETVVIMEALKMQMEIKTARAGRVHYRVNAGDVVRAQAVLAEVL